MAGGAEIDDAQTRMTKNADAVRRRPKAAIIRPAMGDTGHQRVDCHPIRRLVQFAGYSAHGIASKIRALISFKKHTRYSPNSPAHVFRYSRREACLAARRSSPGR